MIRILLFVVVIFAFAAAFAWLADHPGTLLITFAGYEISTSLLVAAVLLVVGMIAVGAVWILIRSLWRSPRLVGSYVAGRRRDRGYRALSRGMIAIGVGDRQAAARFATESQHYLRGEPLTLLLAAQAAQLGGDGMGARSAFEAMVAEPETRLLGLRGLFVEARRRGDAAAARSFAEEAMRERPGIGWAGTALLEYQAADRDWQGALKTLTVLANAGVLERPAAQRLEAVLLTARASELEGGDPEAARGLALEAHRLAPGLVPAAVLASRLSARQGDLRRAAKIIETSWKVEPHPELASAYMAARPGDGVRDRLKRVQALARIRANHREGLLALARAAIDAKDWALARESLNGPVVEGPSERVCALMAEIEEGEHADIGRARDWLARAVNAPPDPTWIADGVVFDHWEPVSPVTGRLDAFEWKSPEVRLIGRPGDIEGATAKLAVTRAPLALPVEAEVEAVADAPPLEDLMPDAATPTADEVKPPPSSDPVLAMPEPVLPSGAPEPGGAPTAAHGANGANGSAPPPAAEPALAHQPDDPGPDPDAPTAATPRRFRLFGF